MASMIYFLNKLNFSEKPGIQNIVSRKSDNLQLENWKHYAIHKYENSTDFCNQYQ